MGASLPFAYAGVVADEGALQFAVELARIAHDHKSENLVALDLRGISDMMDFVVLSTGTSDRQMRTVVDMCVEYGKRVGQRPFGKSGYENAAWILVDYIDVVFHIFSREYRNFYDLELLWGDAPRVEWSRSESA